MLNFKMPLELRGKRLDSALTTLLPQISAKHFGQATRSQISRLISAGGVVHKDTVLEKGYILKGGESLKVDLGLWQRLSCESIVREFSDKDFTFDFPILYEDEFFIIGNKPAGVLVHPTRSSKEPTIIDLLRKKNISLSQTDEVLKPGVVHRLDRGTSGLLIVAKEIQTHFLLQKLFQERKIKKYYLALTIGGKLQEASEIRAKLSRKPTHRKLFRTFSSGRLAITRFFVLNSSPLFSLLFLRILTGRTHQIRVHLALRGQFVVNDTDYGARLNRELQYFLQGAEDKSYKRVWSEAVPKELRPKVLEAIKSCPGIFLHAYKLSFLHPRTQALVSVTAPLPGYFETMLRLSQFSIDEELLNRAERALNG